MPKFGIVVEGVEDGVDEQSHTIFIQRLANGKAEIVARPCDGTPNFMRRFPNFLEEFRYIPGIEKAFIIRDSDGKSSQILRREMAGKIAGRSAYPFNIYFPIACQELEAWFLSDESYLSRKINKNVRRQPNPDLVNNPKERLIDILLKEGIYYTAAVAKEFAESMDLNVIAARSPSFAEFRKFILA